jgi:hypothetical protein
MLSVEAAEMGSIRLNSDKNVQESDTTDADSSNAAKYIIILPN